MSSSHLTLLLKRVFGLILVLVLWFILSLSPLCRSLVRKIINRQSNNMSYGEEIPFASWGPRENLRPRELRPWLS